MSAPSTVPIESKSAKKRRNKSEPAATDSPVGRVSPNPESTVNGQNADGSGGIESPYLKELSKNIRNLHKKLAASVKADHVVEQNPGISLDELVSQKKLNADQKAQLLKKPQLQAQVAQLEEQQKHYQSFAKEMQETFEKEKASLIESHEAQLAQAKQEATDAATSSHNETSEKSLTVISGFLHAAAAKRQSEDQESEEARAFEGALLLVYQGNAQSLSTLKNLVEGTDEKVTDVEGNALDYTFAQIKEAALKDAGGLVEEAEPAPAAAHSTETEEQQGNETPEAPSEPMTDPTVAHAGLTELEDTTTIPLNSNGEAEPDTETIAPEQTSAGDEGANAAAEAAWDPQASMTSNQTSDEFVIVARDPAETETGSSAPAVQQSTSNWADETAAEEKAAPENDGFEQVKRERGRGRGGYRGGRGFDGRGRGRGRGEYRGRGGPGRGGRGRGDRAPQAAPAPQTS